MSSENKRPGVVLTTTEFTELLDDSVIAPWLLLKEVVKVGDSIAVPLYTDFPKDKPTTQLGDKFKSIYMELSRLV